MRPRPCPWWDRHCRLSYKYKLRLFAKRNSSAKYLVAYKNAVKKCKYCQRRVFRVYNGKLKHKLKGMKPSSKAFWRLTKQIAGLSRVGSKSAPNAEKLASHFAEKMSNAADAEDNCWTPRSNSNASLRSFRVSYDAVVERLQKLDTSKSINSIPNYLLKNCAKAIAPSMCRLFKFICNRAQYPSSWKVGRITPLHKKGKMSDVKMYRPVTVAPNEGLVFEGVLYDEFYDFLDNHIPKSQFGFLRGCGTQDYGAALVMQLVEILERRNQAVVISLDVAGAFDRVWHSGLLKKLQKKGTSGKALKLIKSYLTDRFIEVVTGSERSSRKQIFSGVPQGGKWSAPLWDFEISTLDELGLDGLLSYADDCSLVYEVSDENASSIIDTINLDLQKLSDWGITWHVSFEPTKTYAMVVSRKRCPFDAAGISFDGFDIEVVKELKLVGFTLDSKMTMGSMVDKLCKKARQKIGALYKLRYNLDANSMEAMYRAFIRSAMEYGNMVHMIAAQTHLDKLDRVQKSAERIGGFSVEPLASRRDASVIGFAFKLLDGKGRGCLNTLTPALVDVVPVKQLRHSLSGIQVTRSHNSSSLKSYERSFIGRLPNIWSSLPAHLIQHGMNNNSWTSVTKKCQRFLVGRDASGPASVKSHDESLSSAGSRFTIYYTTTELIAFKPQGIPPLGFNEHSKVPRAFAKETLITKYCNKLNQSINAV